MSLAEQNIARSAHLDAVDRAVTAARAHRGSLLVVAGSAGGGKTSFLQQAHAMVGDRTLTVSVSCRALADQPFRPWRSLLDQTRRQLRHPLLVPAAEGGLPPITPRDHADRLLALWATADRPVVVLIDDADLMDPSSQLVAEHLARDLSRETVVLVLTVTEGHDDGRLTWVDTLAVDERLPLDGLNAHDIATLLRSYDPGAPAALLDAAVEYLIAQGGAHPLTVVTRLRRLASRVAPDELVAALLSESDAPVAVSGHQWIRHCTDELDPDSRRIVAQWTVAPSLTRAQFCDATGTSSTALEQAVRAAARAGLLASPLVGAHEVPSPVRDVLLATLPPAVMARTHLQVGRALLQTHATAVIEAAHHLERASDLVPTDELVEVLDRASDMALQSSAFHEADRLSALAQSLSPTPHGQAQRLLRRSRALRGQGRPVEADELARLAASAATGPDEADLMAEAVVDLTTPPDWRVGDAATQHLLEHALARTPSPTWRVRLLAGQAHQWFQLPRSGDGLDRWTWQFRPDLAAGVADQAVAEARRLADDDALVAALLAWRSVNRQPSQLAQRREVSAEALGIAVRRRDTAAMVQAAVRVAVDELESGHRDGFEHAVVMARWAADRSIDTRLLWRAHLLEATRAVLDGDLDALERSKGQAVRAGRLADAPGREAAELVLDRHVLALSNGWSVVAAMTPDADWPLVHHPLGVAGAAEAMARAGRVDHARRLLSRLRWPAEPNTSMLLVTTLAARTAVWCGDQDTAVAVLPTLVQFADHVAVDPEALWVEGPVALAGAAVADLLGDHQLAADLMRRATDRNRTLDCARTASVLAETRRRGGRSLVLPEREHAVLRLLADGLSNAQIATTLNFSVSTIRRETTSLYHRLGVGNRAGAVARAHDLGLL